MIAYTLTDELTASDPTKADPSLREQMMNESLTHEQRAELAKTLRQSMAVEVSDEERAEIDALHESLKPEVPEGGVYQLIALNAHRKPSGKLTGILNCRVDGEHIQVRF